MSGILGARIGCTACEALQRILSIMLEKPAYGSPCNSCGQCCQDELCPLGNRIFGPRPGPCPAIAELSSGFGCGLMLTPWRFAPEATSAHGADAMRKAAALLCGAGAGCDAIGHDEHVEDDVRARVIGATRAFPEAEIAHARKLWRGES